ncbi:MAG: hypothetical protein F6J86_36280 [Symploca sp. SIO1B1]|nr:hypothetical protein [Symploca sp. SIO1B1]
MNPLEDSEMQENIKMGITISAYDRHRLKIWAMLHGKTPTTYAAQIISARIESNFDNINKQLEDYAKTRGQTVDEVLKELEGEGDSD